MIRLLPLALVLSAPAPAQPGERRFDLDRFDAVELRSSDAVRVMPGAVFSVTAGGDPRAVASLAITVADGTLRVGRTPGRHSDRGAIVTVVVPSLRAATLSGSGSIRATGISGPAFAARIGGSGSMTLTALSVTRARLDLGGSGSIIADGSADTVAIDLGGSGRVDTRRLVTSSVAVDLGGSGSVAAAASGEARIQAGGSGSVRIEGRPRCTVRNSGTAVVRCG